MSTLERMSRNRPVIIFRGEVFKVTQAYSYDDSSITTGKLEEKLYPYKINYVASLSQCIDEIKNKSSEFTSTESRKLKIMLNKYKLINERLLPLFEPGMGVYERNEQFYVFLDTGYYILKNHEGRDYYLFPPARIGVEVVFSRQNMNAGYPVVMNKYAHPFLKGHYSMQEICMGRWGGTQRESELSRFTGELKEEKKIIYTLKKARQIIESGYRPGCEPHISYLSEIEEMGGCEKISKERALSSGIPITNTT